MFAIGGITMQIAEQIKQTIVNLLKIKPEELKAGVSLEDCIGVDSTEMVEIAIALSKSFNVKITDRDISKNSTLEDIEKTIKTKLGQ